MVSRIVDCGCCDQFFSFFSRAPRGRTRLAIAVAERGEVLDECCGRTYFAYGTGTEPGCSEVTQPSDLVKKLNFFQDGISYYWH